MKSKPKHTIMKKPIRTRVNALAIVVSMALLISSHTANAQNVGIGTPTPGSKLSVAGNAMIGSGYAGLAGPTNGLAVQGNVGIGTTTPGYKLTIAGAGDIFAVDNTASFLAKNASGTYERYLWPRWSDNVMYLNYGSAGFNIRNNSSATTMFMTNNGNVGIGTTAPGKKLHLYVPNNDGIRIHASQGGGWGSARVEFYSNPIGSANEWRPGYIASGDNSNYTGRLDFYTNGTGSASKLGSVLGMSITNGNVGIGTTAPAQKLDVVGNVRFSGALMPAGNAGTSDQVLTSQGANSAPVWKSISSIPGIWRLVYVDSWDAANNTPQGWSGAAVTNCGGQYMLGGYGQCGSGCILRKTFSSLPPHTEVMVKVYYWRLDTWDQLSGNIDQVSLRLAGTTVAIGIPAQVATSSEANLSTDASRCGEGGFVDQGPFPLVGRITHSASSILVEVVSGLSAPSTNESVGVVAVEVWCK